VYMGQVPEIKLMIIVVGLNGETEPPDSLQSTCHEMPF